jgi:hypothetical protein
MYTSVLQKKNLILSQSVLDIAGELKFFCLEFHRYFCSNFFFNVCLTLILNYIHIINQRDGLFFSLYFVIMPVHVSGTSYTGPPTVALTLSVPVVFKFYSPPCLVILQPYGNRGVLVLRQDGWHERLRSTCTLVGLKVLKVKQVLLPHCALGLLMMGYRWARNL